MFDQPFIVIMYDVHKYFNAPHQPTIDAIRRPDILFFKMHNPTSNDSFSKTKKVTLKSNRIPHDIAKILSDPKHKKLCWDAESTQAITHSLLTEAGISYNHYLDDYIDVKDLLYDYGYTCRSLSQIAKQFKLPVCPKANARKPLLIAKRFKVLNAVVSKIITIDGLNLFDGILI